MVVKWTLRLLKVAGWLWVFVCLFGGLVSLRRGDTAYSLWIAASSWPGFLLLLVLAVVRRRLLAK